MMSYNPRQSVIADSQRVFRSTRIMAEYLIAAILFVAMITTLVYLWKRERG